MKVNSSVHGECDEWLSTRNKKKINKPARSLKRHHAAIRKIGHSSKLWKMTQNSPPPAQLLTFTKQSDLMSYFNKKQDRELSENEKGPEEAMTYEGDHDPLTNQFGFLSQEEKTLNSYESNQRNSRDKVTYTSDVEGSDVEFLTQENSNTNTNIEPRKNLNYVDIFSPSEHINESDIDFHSMNTIKISIPKYTLLDKKPTKVYSDGNSDIDFLSQSPNSNSENDNEKTNSESCSRGWNYEELEENKHDKSTKLANYISERESSEDIEFISQREQQNLVLPPVKDSCLLTSDDSSSSENVTDNLSHCHANEKRYPTHKDKKCLKGEARNTKCISSLYIDRMKPYQYSNTRNLLVMDNSDIDFESQCSAEDICVPSKTGLKGNNLKGLNGNSYYFGRRSFEDLPETIKFTESETDSCEDVMTRHKM